MPENCFINEWEGRIILMCSILEVNVDDLYNGGVFSLIKNIIINNDFSMDIDIAAIEKFVNEDNVKQLEKYGTSIYYIGRKGNKLIKQIFCYRNLKRLLYQNKYHCVHIHGDVANKLLVSGLASKMAGMNRIILHSHAAGVDGKHRTWKTFIHKICRPFLKYLGTEFVACSDVAAKWMYPNVNSGDVIYIYNGVDLDKFKFDYKKRLVVREKLGINTELLIGHVGRYAYQKNHDFLLKVFHCVMKNVPEAKLLLVGTGPLEESVKNWVKQYKMVDNVIFYGTSSCVDELFQAMDVFVLPSHFEGFPIVGVEAQANGVPIVCSTQITKELKLNENMEYLPISDNDIERWSNKILVFSKCKREDATQRLREKGLDINETMKRFYELYIAGE